MLKKVLLLIGFFTLINTLYSKSYADSSWRFISDYQINYDVNEDGETLVTQKILITNQQNDIIATTYSITLKRMEVYDISASDKSGILDIDQNIDNDAINIMVKFDNFVVGEGKQNEITLKYKTHDIATKTGEIWNINIPQTQFSDSTTSYNVTLSIPVSFGEMIALSPTPVIEKTEKDKYIFNYIKQNLQGNAITASFGKYQVVNFRLLYQLENPSILSVNYDVALPPDVAGVQQINYSSINPHPKDIFKDSDGNIIAAFNVKPKRKFEVELVGVARISGKQINPNLGGSFKSIPNKLRNKYTGEEKFWETAHPAVKNISTLVFDEKHNVSQNAYNIYKYLVDNFSYNYQNDQLFYTDRNGAGYALNNPGKWACMEFTDTFISIARSQGIPARELNGYAINSENSKKPLSISFKGGDYLHAWPEYYDPNFGWVAIDPTWGDTSGTDYFTKLDTNHLVFVIKGSNSEHPLPAGAYRTDENKKLVEVSIAQEYNSDFVVNTNIKRVLNLNLIKLLQGYDKYKITNQGKIILYTPDNKEILPNKTIKVYLKKDLTSIELKDAFSQIYQQGVPD